jgi:hypothetical protein
MGHNLCSDARPPVATNASPQGGFVEFSIPATAPQRFYGLESR